MINVLGPAPPAHATTFSRARTHDLQYGVSMWVRGVFLGCALLCVCVCTSVRAYGFVGEFSCCSCVLPTREGGGEFSGSGCDCWGVLRGFISRHEIVRRYDNGRRKLRINYTHTHTHDHTLPHTHTRRIRSRRPIRKRSVFREGVNGVGKYTFGILLFGRNNLSEKY